MKEKLSNYKAGLFLAVSICFAFLPYEGCILISLIDCIGTNSSMWHRVFFRGSYFIARCWFPWPIMLSHRSFFSVCLLCVSWIETPSVPSGVAVSRCSHGGHDHLYEDDHHGHPEPLQLRGGGEPVCSQGAPGQVQRGGWQKRCEWPAELCVCDFGGKQGILSCLLDEAHLYVEMARWRFRMLNGSEVVYLHKSVAIRLAGAVWVSGNQCWGLMWFLCRMGRPPWCWLLNRAVWRLCRSSSGGAQMSTWMMWWVCSHRKEEKHPPPIPFGTRIATGSPWQQHSVLVAMVTVPLLHFSFVVQDCWTALISAAKEGHVEVVKELLENSAYIEHRDMVRGEETWPGRRSRINESGRYSQFGHFILIINVKLVY